MKVGDTIHIKLYIHPHGNGELVVYHHHDRIIPPLSVTLMHRMEQDLKVVDMFLPLLRYLPSVLKV